MIKQLRETETETERWTERGIERGHDRQTVRQTETGTDFVRRVIRTVAYSSLVLRVLEVFCVWALPLVSLLGTDFGHSYFHYRLILLKSSQSPPSITTQILTETHRSPGGKFQGR